MKGKFDMNIKCAKARMSNRGKKLIVWWKKQMYTRLHTTQLETNIIHQWLKLENDFLN